VSKLDEWQLEEIALGKEAGLDTSIYAREDLNWMQMREIRKGLEKNLDVSVYADPKIRWMTMWEIRLRLEAEQAVMLLEKGKETKGE
jgi:V8-like Glu-specific endopeptidase